MTFKPYQPWYDDERDYNTNAPSYYDYLANSVNLEKVQSEAINDLLVRDVDFLDSDEIHVDKLTDWHTDDPSHQNKTSFKAHVITSPKNLTYTFDGVDYVAPNSIKVLDSGLYSPDYSKIISNAQARLNEVSTIAKKADDKSLENAKSITALSNATNEKFNNVQSKFDNQQLQIDSKQVKLNAGKGMELSDNNKIGLLTFSNYQGDLNNFNRTAYALIQNQQCPNLPTGVILPALLYTFVSDNTAITQYLISDVNGKMYTRGGRISSNTTTWSSWFIPTSHDEVVNQINTVNKSYNLQNPDIFKFHKFANIGTTGDWGFEFFNDTNSKIYNVKVKVGTITEANQDTIIAQQNTSDLLKAGVPQDFITKATNGYVFRTGYFIGDSLNRIAFELKTESDKLNLRVKYYDGSATIRNQLIVQGPECTPIAVPYNNAISIEETAEEKPVVDGTNEETTEEKPTLDNTNE